MTSTTGRQEHQVRRRRPDHPRRQCLPPTSARAPARCAAARLPWVRDTLPSRRHGRSDQLWDAQDRTSTSASAAVANTAYAAFIQDDLAQAVRSAHSDGGADDPVHVALLQQQDTERPRRTTASQDCTIELAADSPPCRSTTYFTVLDPGGAAPRWSTASPPRAPNGVRMPPAADQHPHRDRPQPDHLQRRGAVTPAGRRRAMAP